MILEDRSYGIIVVFENRFLLIQEIRGHWAFPKGHSENGETPKEAALRELKEETGIGCDLLDAPSIFDEYSFTWDDGKDYHKIVEYFIGNTKNDRVTIQAEEISQYKWATYEEALEILTYDNTKQTLKKAKAYLDTYEQNKSAE